MKYFKCPLAYIDNKWQEHKFITVDEEGVILSISDKNPSNKDYEYKELKGAVAPGFINAHSHAFQYAMAGMSENISAENMQDDFWSWRDRMYRLALGVTPDDVEVIATYLYSQMLSFGITSVAEFHYIHKDPKGKSYNNLAEMGSRLIKAAKNTGMNITLIPIYYNRGDFGQDIFENQKRFYSNNTDEYFKLIESSKKAASLYKGASVGVGIHSLRAASFEDVKIIANESSCHAPFHIHVSEQLKEVEKCTALYGVRPVQWLLDNLELSSRYHLIHATHLDETETLQLAKSEAVVVICPTTEANLGDGIFPLRSYRESGGGFSIGSDSHVSLPPLQELRLLDYSQRLSMRRRNPVCIEEGEESGDLYLNAMWSGGAKSTGVEECGELKVGSKFNAVVFDDSQFNLNSQSKNKLNSFLVFASTDHIYKDTYINGSQVVANGIHINHDLFYKDFIKMINKI